MTYAPPPYIPPATAANPTSVMGRRITAALIDILIPLVIAFIVFATMWADDATAYEAGRYDSRYYSCSDATSPGDDQMCIPWGDTLYVVSNDDAGSAYGAGFLVWLIFPLNAFLLQGLTGATLGKHIFGLRVVRGDGNIANFGWNALRTLLLMVATFLNFLCGAGYIGELITACVTKKHQRVGDMAAGTYVVRKASVGTSLAFAGPQSYGHPMPQQQWAPPPTGSPYGAQTPAPTQWGAPQQTTPPQTPPQQTPPQQAPMIPTAAPTSNIPPVWGAQETPTSFPTETPPAETPPAPAESADPTVPRWDAARNAYIAWEPSRGAWMQHDTTTNEWQPI